MKNRQLRSFQLRNFKAVRDSGGVRFCWTDHVDCQRRRQKQRPGRLKSAKSHELFCLSRNWKNAPFGLA